MSWFLTATLYFPFFFLSLHQIWMISPRKLLYLTVCYWISTSLTSCSCSVHECFSVCVLLRLNWLNGRTHTRKWTASRWVDKESGKKKSDLVFKVGFVEKLFCRAARVRSDLWGRVCTGGEKKKLPSQFNSDLNAIQGFFFFIIIIISTWMLYTSSTVEFS